MAKNSKKTNKKTAANNAKNADVNTKADAKADVKADTKPAKRQSRQIQPDWSALSERCDLIVKALAELGEVAARHPSSVGKSMKAFSKASAPEGNSVYWFQTGLALGEEKASPRDWVRDLAQGWAAMSGQIESMAAFYKAMVTVEEQAKAADAAKAGEKQAKAMAQLEKAQKALEKLEKKLAKSPDDEELQGKIKVKRARIKKLAKKAGV